MQIIQDSREAAPWHFRGLTPIVEKLDVGDYSLDGHQHIISIERKSAMDLFGTLGKGRDRFVRELERAKRHEVFVIIIESSFRDIRDKNFHNSHRTKMCGDVILKILNTLKLKYGFDVYFANDKNEASSIARWIFSNYLRYKENPKYKESGFINSLKYIYKIDS